MRHHSYDPQKSFPFQRAMPPGMLQQMQRQMRSGGGMQEMIKAMMQGQGGDQFDMEEMQRKSSSSVMLIVASP